MIVDGERLDLIETYTSSADPTRLPDAIASDSAVTKTPSSVYSPHNGDCCGPYIRPHFFHFRVIQFRFRHAVTQPVMLCLRRVVPRQCNQANTGNGS